MERVRPRVSFERRAVVGRWEEGSMRLVGGGGVNWSMGVGMEGGRVGGD